jgi:AraC family transcriptional regulator
LGTLTDKKRSILEIALQCGYSSPAAFSKSFKKFHGIAPSEWNQNSNSGQMNRNNDKDPSANLLNTDAISNWRYVMEKKDVRVEVKEIEPKTLAYIRYIGPYAGDEALFARLYGQLYKWAGPRNYITEETEFISIYHDNPEITDENKLRVSICLTVPNDTVGEGDINIMTIPGGKYAVGHFEIDPSEYGEAWNFMCGEWLSNSGYEPDDRPCFELMVKNPEDHPENKHVVDIYEPVRPM